MKKKYNLERFPKITIMKYNPNMDVMYRAITLDDLCVDISVKRMVKSKLIDMVNVFYLNAFSQGHQEYVLPK